MSNSYSAHRSKFFMKAERGGDLNMMTLNMGSVGFVRALFIESEWPHQAYHSCVKVKT